MPLVVTHPTCEQLPAAPRKVVCETPPEAITVAEAGDRTLVIGLHVMDGRAWDGPYLETRAVWASWKPVADEGALAELLAGLGPVSGRKTQATKKSPREWSPSCGSVASPDRSAASCPADSDY